MGSSEAEAVSSYLAAHRDFLRGWLLENSDSGWLKDVAAAAAAGDAPAPQQQLPPPPPPVRVAPPRSRTPTPSRLNIKEEEEEGDGDSGDVLSAAEDSLLRSVIRRPRKSVTSDLFHQWLESSGSARWAGGRSRTAAHLIEMPIGVA